MPAVNQGGLSAEVCVILHAHLLVVDDEGTISAGDALLLLLLCTEILISVVYVFHKHDIQSSLCSFVEDLSFKEFLLRWRRKQAMA